MDQTQLHALLIRVPRKMSDRMRQAFSLLK
jgi:hypothetical protein